MDIKKLFSFLVEDYDFTYIYQDFHSYCGGKYSVHTHSFYNDSGCFTIHYFPPRGELDFYVSPRFSNDYDKLCNCRVNVYLIEEAVWRKRAKIWFFPNPFFWWSNEKILKTLVEVLKIHLKQEGSFCGITVAIGKSPSMLHK